MCEMTRMFLRWVGENIKLPQRRLERG